MATYKKASDYSIATDPNDDDLIPSIVVNPDGSKWNRLIPYYALKGLPGQDGAGVPAGGTTSQVLQKASNTDHDTQWVTMSLTKAAVGLGNVDNTSDANKPVSTATQAAIDAAVASAIAQSKQQSYPIGSLYFNATDATNPATLLGFGTWSAYAEGRVPVGKAPSGTFATAGSTGGAETHTLQVSEIPSHVHGQVVTANSGPNGRKDFVGEAPSSTYDQSANTWPTGGGGAHNNLQPYITVYIWRRTA